MPVLIYAVTYINGGNFSNKTRISKMAEKDTTRVVKVPLGNVFPSSKMFEAASENNWEEVFNLILARAKSFKDFTGSNDSKPRRNWNILIYACNSGKNVNISTIKFFSVSTILLIITSY